MDLQGGASASWATPNMSTSSPSSTSPSEGTNYGSGDIRNTLLRYQLEFVMKEHDHARRIATLSANMLNEVVAHVVRDDEVNAPKRQCRVNERKSLTYCCVHVLRLGEEFDESVHSSSSDFFECRECTKHRKSLANTAITKDLVQPKRMYGGLDARLALEVVPCEMWPGTAWMSLITCWLKCWMSANGALLYQWNSWFCFHPCSLPLLGVIGFQNSTSLPAYGFKGNSTSCTPFMSDSICFDMELPGLHTYVLVGLFGFSLVLLHMLFGTCISNVLRLVRLQLGLPLSLHGLFGFGGARGSTEL
ncbi:hypothetical protein SO802_010892 [Lithocarpus litseifolius]|uniref:Uncharacterized protein n=1 Tax=Lithocarpus litseifolius TaxID=425828 RepID=A0AAW2DFG3_9ROSI